MWTDQVTIQIRWKKYFDQLNDQWAGHIIHSSILLIANIVFLLVRNYDGASNSFNRFLFRRPQQISSYLSILASLTSTTVAQLLGHQHRIRGAKDGGDMHAFLAKMHHQTRSFESLASLYAVPYAVLLWGQATFFASFLLMCFERKNIVVQLIIGISTVPFLILCAWCIWMGWNESGAGITAWVESKIKMFKMKYHSSGTVTSSLRDQEMTGILDTGQGLEPLRTSNEEVVQDQNASHRLSKWFLALFSVSSRNQPVDPESHTF